MISITRHLRTALAAAGIALSVMPAANAGTLKLGMTTWVGYGPLFLAKDLGYFKENGLDVDISIIEGAAPELEKVTVPADEPDEPALDEPAES